MTADDRSLLHRALLADPARKHESAGGKRELVEFFALLEIKDVKDM